MASRSVNKVILIGHLGKDAETKFTPGGTSRTIFPLATSRRWKDQATGEWKEETEWHNVVMWRGENVANYLQKGKQIYVEGRLKTRNYEDKDGRKVYVTEVVADDVILLSGRGDSGGGDYGQSAGYEQEPQSYSTPRPSGQASPGTSHRQPQSGSQGGGSTPYQYGEITDDDVPF